MSDFKVGDKIFKRFRNTPYLVSRDGRIYSETVKRELRGHFDYRGYQCVTAKHANPAGRYMVHHMVMEVYVGLRPLDCVVNHIDANPSNNSLENLEYVTPKENREHAKRLGLYHAGTGHRAAKISPREVVLARKGKELGFSLTELARAFKISKKSILNIVDGKIWKSVLEETQNVSGK